MAKTYRVIGDLYHRSVGALRVGDVVAEGHPSLKGNEHRFEEAEPDAVVDHEAKSDPVRPPTAQGKSKE